MTRINFGIDPTELIDEHLRAEIRELPRIFTEVNKKIEKGTIDKIKVPPKFKLGTGHCTFFYNKLSYLSIRLKYLHKEYYNRSGKKWNYEVDYSSIIKNIKSKAKYLYKNCDETLEGRELLIERINFRIKHMKKEPHYYGEKLTRNEALIFT